jgi:hypothetical protein
LRENDPPISFSGHIRLSSPSVCKQRKEKKPIQYGFADDIFMYGMSLYEIAQGYTGDNRIWPNLGNWEAADKIIAGERPPITRKISPNFLKLIQDCWQQESGNTPDRTNSAYIFPPHIFSSPPRNYFFPSTNST